MPRAQTLVKSETKISTNVAVGIGVVAIAAIIATFGPRMIGNFAVAPMSSGLANTTATATSTATSTTAFGCTDTDGGKNFTVKGTATVGNFSLTDSCKNATTLNEAWCDPARKYVNNVEQKCSGQCLESKCVGTGVITSASSSIEKIVSPDNSPRIHATFAFSIKAEGGDISLDHGLQYLADYTIYKNGQVFKTGTSIFTDLSIGGRWIGANPWQEIRIGSTRDTYWKLVNGQIGTVIATMDIYGADRTGTPLAAGLYKIGVNYIKVRPANTNGAWTNVSVVGQSYSITNPIRLP